VRAAGAMPASLVEHAASVAPLKTSLALAAQAPDDVHGGRGPEAPRPLRQPEPADWGDAGAAAVEVHSHPPPAPPPPPLHKLHSRCVLRAKGASPPWPAHRG
jgi:hypothetical protein